MLMQSELDGLKGVEDIFPSATMVAAITTRELAHRHARAAKSATVRRYALARMSQIVAES